MSESIDWKLPWAAGCRCGQVRLTLSAPPLLTMACHCTGCQRMSASAFSLSVAIPTPGFSILHGEPVIGGMHGASQHYFCSHCKSWMFTRMAGLDQFVNVRAMMLDDRQWYVPFVETYTDEKLAWASTPAKHSYAKYPPLEAYESLIAEYQANPPRA